MRTGKAILFMFTILFLSSCEKVIDLKLDDKSGQLVIEGEVTDQDLAFTVKISRSASFDAMNNFEKVNNAVVSISDNTGNTDTLLPQGNGLYKTQYIKGIAGRTYSLKVLVDGKQYSAQSTMPSAVSLDTLGLAESDDGVQYLTPVYRDDATVKNFYRFNTFINSKQTIYINVRNDDITNGNVVTEPLIMGFATGDTVMVQMLCIDKPNYTYFFSLDQIAGFGETATPANPVSNISGGCLGYFSANTVREKTVVIK